MRFNDAIIGAALILFAVAEIAYARTFPSLHGQNYGPSLFPVLIGLGLAGCGLLLVIKGLLARRNNNDAESVTAVHHWVDFSRMSQSHAARINAVLIILIPLVYVLFSEAVGFIPVSFTAVAILLYRLGASWLITLVVAFCCTGIIQILFAKVLLVPLPAGWLQGYL